MASQSSDPPNPSNDNKPQNPVTEVVQPTNEIRTDNMPESTTKSPPSVFVNSEPVREDQVQNAVKFLSHPKVRGSPVIYRRSFLERKGLTKEEIDEAFRRVPDPPPTAQPATTNQEGQAKSTPSVQQPVGPLPAQTLQPAAANAPASVGILSRFHWYHALLAAGLLTISGAGTAVLIKNVIVPRLKSWIRKVVFEEEDDPMKKNAKPSMAEEAAAAAKAAAAAAADVAKASQEMLNSKNQEKRYFEEFTNLLAVQLQEMKSMSSSIRKLEGQTNNLGRTSLVDHEDRRVSVTNSKQPYMNGKADFDSHSARSSSLPLSAEPSSAPHSKSYMEIMAMVQRGERPPNIRDIDDKPPNPNQQISNPRLVPRSKPWEVGQYQSSSSQVLQAQGSEQVLDYKVQDNGLTHQFDGESTTPWWQKKSARITEIENDDELKAGPSGGRTNELPVRPTWVPPQPPPVAMPEAAEAIRRPKPSVQKEQLADNQSVPHPTDELQKITKLSESGVIQTNGGPSEMSTSEIQEEQEHHYE